MSRRSEASGPELDLFGKAPVGRADWSHRRREPRGLALMWTVYLMLATVVSLIPMVLSGQLSGDVYRPSARVMIVMVMVGLMVLWPMLRVSQPRNSAQPVLDVSRDLGVLFFPAMVLVWPQAVLAGWSVPVLGAASVVLVVWGLIAGSALLWWHRYSAGGVIGRFAVTACVAGLAAALPLVLALAGRLALGPPIATPAAGWLWSPATAVWEVLRERSWTGMPAAVSGAHWSVLRVQIAIACVIFVVSAAVCRGGSGAVDREDDRPGELSID